MNDTLDPHADVLRDIDIDTLKKMGEELLNALPTSTPNEVENGFKLFSIAYLNAKFDNDRDSLQASILMSIIGKKKIEHEITYGMPDVFLGE